MSFSSHGLLHLWRQRVIAPALLLVLAAAPLPALLAQAPTPASAAAAHDPKDLTGDWQGTLKTPQRDLRLVFRVSKAPKGWTAKMFSIDQAAPSFDAAVALDGNTVKFSLELIGFSSTGTLAGDGNAITGTASQGGTDLPFNLVRATKETAWEIPAPPAPPKLMAADADPSFDVATVKPNDSGKPTMQQLTVNGRDFRAVNASLADLMSFSFEVQKKQIVGAPDWLDKDRFDIAGVPDAEGAPNVAQLRSMIRKLIVERFQMKFHNEKRDMSAFVLTIGKDGPKLKETQVKGPLPGLGFRPTPAGLTFNSVNASIHDVASIFQTLLLDRPVVDRTGLTGHYDMVCTFTPDDSMFSGHPPTLPAKSDTTTESAPSLAEALNAQLGLKLEAQKTPVDVVVIDHAEKPSAN